MPLPPIPDAQPAPASPTGVGTTPADPAKPPAATPAPAAPPSPASPSGPEGKVTVDDKLTLECELACYRSTAALGREIARELRARVFNRAEGTSDTYVVFYTPVAAASLQAYQAFTLQAAEIRQALTPGRSKPAKVLSSSTRILGLLTVPAVTAATAAGAAVLGLATNFLSLFRTDRDYKGRPVTINERAVFAAVARHLIGDDPPIHVFDPSGIILTPAVAGLTGGPILGELHELHALRDKAHVTLDSGGAAEMGDILQELGGVHAGETHEALRNMKVLDIDPHDAPERVEEQPAALGKRLKTISAGVTTEKKHLEHVDQLLDDLVKGLSAVDPKTGASMMALAQQGASLIEYFKGDAYFLEIDVLTAGGSYVTERHWLSNRAGYTGGLAVAYTLTNGSGEIVWADMAQRRERGSMDD